MKRRICVWMATAAVLIGGCGTMPEEGGPGGLEPVRMDVESEGVTPLQTTGSQDAAEDLSLQAADPEASSQDYSMATSKEAWEVEDFAREVQGQILAGDYQGLCRNIAFPITVDGVVYQDGDAFLAADFVEDPNPEFLEELRAETCGNMFANYQGIMMGDGILWIGEVTDSGDSSSKVLKVIGINGLTAVQ